jgi:hypothetical protein
MTFLYIVRCNFTRPDREAEWNAWYGGEKIAQLLAKPMFLAAQRFRRAAGAGRDYLALWQVASPAALATPEYKADWGFAQWRDDVSDWSRDLFDAGAAAAETLAVPERGALAAIAFDGAAPEAAAAAQAMVKDWGALWCPCVGLDRHTPAIALRRFDDAAAGTAALARPLPAGTLAALYRPIGAFVRAGRAA